MKFLVALFISASLLFAGLANGQFSASLELLLGSKLKEHLESKHYSKKALNDDLSEKAYKEFLERLDFRKHFFTQKDLAKFEKYKKKMDDEFTTGNLELLDLAHGVLISRVKSMKALVEKKLKKPITFNSSETLETDPEKREWPKDDKELNHVWDQTIRLAVLNEIIDLDDAQKGLTDEAKKEAEKAAKKNKNKNKNNKKKKKEKLKTVKQLEKEAREKVGKDYKSYFSRILREKKMVKLSKFYNSVIRIFDPHTYYLQPDDREDFNINLSGKLEGIGAVLVMDGAFIKVERIVPGSASWKQKELKKEDIILKVAQSTGEPVSIVNMDIRDAVKLIRGEKGSEVRLTVKKPTGEVKIVPIIRDVVEIEESYARSLIFTHDKMKQKIGYINLPSFYRDFNPKPGEAPKNCTDDVTAEIKKLKKAKVEGIILDLRNNGGGSLEDARLMSGLFIKKGPIVQVKDSSGEILILEDFDSDVLFDKPLIVMVNRFSASASEILAGALQDYGRAVILGGDFTHGKGTVQTVMNLDHSVPTFLRSMVDSLGALKITIQQFYRISGGSTQNRGIVPDVILPDRLSFLESGERFLDYSLPWQKVNALKYKMWSPQIKNMDTIRKNSQERVSKSEAFDHIKKYVKYMKEQKDKTVQPLSLEALRKDREDRRKIAEKYKDDEINKSIKVTHQIKIRDDIEKEKIQEFIDNLRKDAYLEETLFVMNDLLAGFK